MESLPVSVVVASWRRPDDLSRCLTALGGQLRDGDEVIVVARRDDAQTAGAVGALDGQVRGLRLEHVDRPGVIAAMDVGLHAARNPIVAFTDDDTVVREGWLERITAHYRADPRVGAVGGRDWIHDANGINDDSDEVVGIVRWYGRVVGNHHLGVGGPREVQILKGANMSFRRDALLAAGFDRKLKGAGSQSHHEVRTSLEVWRRGWTLVYDPDVALDHYMSVRHDDQRGASPQRSSQDVFDSAHNHFYALLAGLRGWRRLTAVAYQLLLGSREDPGLVLGLERAALAGQGAGALRRALAATRGRLAAFSTLAASRARRG